ncbi:hypothetical protein quinque_012907 [Culex quinquefasciatus]
MNPIYIVKKEVPLWHPSGQTDPIQIEDSSGRLSCLCHRADNRVTWTNAASSDGLSDWPRFVSDGSNCCTDTQRWPNAPSHSHLLCIAH